MIRLASVTPGRLRRVPQWRLIAATGALLLALLTLLAPHVEPPASVAAPSLAAALEPDSLAARIPHVWLAAAPPRLAAGNHVDVVGSRPGDRFGVASVIVDARVLEAGPDAVVLALAPEDLSALVAARANAYLLMLVIRSGR